MLAEAEAKQISCPHCHRMAMVVGHGLLMGYAEHTSEQETRGRRLLCSGRSRRSGCGRTFSVLLATMMAGFAVRTHSLSRLVEGVVAGLYRKAAWERMPPPASTDERPIAQMLAHLRQALGASECVFAAFQLVFQRGVFG